MPRFVRAPEALAPGDFDRLKARLLSSSFIADSQLMGTFADSKGFALVFTARGADEVRGRFPELAPYLEAATGEAPRQALGKGLLRRRALPAPNAFYLNLLLLGPGDKVGAHVDATLRDPSGDEDATPTMVSVLYLEVPASGGELVLAEGPVVVEKLPPEARAMVWFQGHLNHAVRPFAASAGARRASLVLEQYHLDEDALARMPRFKVQSKAGFGAYLRR